MFSDPLKILVVLAALVMLSGCAGMTQQRPVATATVHHVVLCWLKDPGNPDHRRRIIETTRGFQGMPGVLEVRAGRVVTSERSLVDDSFDVGIYLRFASVEDMKRYLVHPVHVSAVRKVIGPLTRKILVYDFVGE